MALPTGELDILQRQLGTEPAYYPTRRLRTEDPYTILELITPDDAHDKFFLEQNNRAHFGRYQMGSNHSSAEDVFGHLLSRHERGTRKGLLAPYKIVRFGLYIGEVSLGRSYRQDPSPLISYHIGEAWQRKGIAKRSVERVIRFAFEEWSAEEVLARIRPSNLPSQLLAHGVGMDPDKGRHLRLVGREGVSSPDGKDEAVTWRIAA